MGIKGIKSHLKQLDFVKEEINSIDSIKEKPSRDEALQGFRSRTIYAYKLMMLEKELIVFAALQWVSIAVGYYLWVQMLDWIPAEVWESTEDSDSSNPADYVLLAWAFICVGIAAFPLGIFTACMGAVHFLHKQGKESTVAGCLKIVLPKAWSLWTFTWIDGWITLKQILRRLPSDDDKTTATERALNEALYYAWKLGTMGILPSLITGRGMIESGKNSIVMVKERFAELAKLRVGYSFISWVIGVSAYIGTIAFFVIYDELIPLEENVSNHMFTFFFWVGVPLLISVAILQLFIRPFYIISLCDIFSEYVEEKGEQVMLPRPPSKGLSAIIAFLILCVLVAVVFLYKDELGISEILATPYE